MQKFSNSVENASGASIDGTADLRKKYLELGALLKEAPSNLNVWVQYLNAAVILDELDDAVETVLACISRVPEPETDFLPLGRMLQQNGWIAYASKIYNEILRCDCFAKQTHSDLIGSNSFTGTTAKMRSRNSNDGTIDSFVLSSVLVQLPKRTRTRPVNFA